MKKMVNEPESVYNTMVMIATQKSRDRLGLTKALKRGALNARRAYNLR
jgi:hypothetical protein